ncbi:biotin-requiring enzyme family protein, putative [Babesia bigemina]|uniref:Biotin-requiring enzyme family protein, putative n=1 Tax=Babesia bigemina TaxID=5866 RepID=A0A061D7C8_BABBI|nr:biotin-requiring enzyme family protein, putative [Babesia bigemina]CDR96616.1 biotin-requiring enzyme family protein, putative [Babesia bigemina]|eukprot:XP_012768802.1 biotin-requiring enzyme family protein, putative [Babesia bigemina]
MFDRITSRCVTAAVTRTRSTFQGREARRLSISPRERPGCDATRPQNIAIRASNDARSYSTGDERGYLEPRVQHLGTPLNSLDCGTLFIVKVPTIGNGVEHGKIHEWHKRRGDQVDLGELICVIETDQVRVDSMARHRYEGVCEGALTGCRYCGRDGCKVNVGGDLIIIRQDEEADEEASDEPEEE